MKEKKIKHNTYKQGGESKTPKEKKGGGREKKGMEKCNQ